MSPPADMVTYMATGRTRQKAALPQLPKDLSPPPEGDRYIDDETDWWQHDCSGLDLSAATARAFHVEQCRFDRADLSNGQWESGVWRDCEFANGSMANTATRSSSMFRCGLESMRLTGLQWTDGVFKDVTFSQSRLDLAGFRFTRLGHTRFQGCRMTGVDFTGADLSGVVFDDCDLTGAKLHQATMTGARLQDCVIDDIAGVEFLKGAEIYARDLIPLTFALARALGITVVAGE
jgi:uncharacterized protein YjbI with pentapeptide repeats